MKSVGKKMVPSLQILGVKKRLPEPGGGGQEVFPSKYWGFLSPMHKKIPDSYSKREGGNPGNSGFLSQQ